jgi:transposase-like protein
MRVTRPTYTPEFREDAVNLLNTTDRSYRQVAEDWGFLSGPSAIGTECRSWLRSRESNGRRSQPKSSGAKLQSWSWLV